MKLPAAASRSTKKQVCGAFCCVRLRACEHLLPGERLLWRLLPRGPAFSRMLTLTAARVRTNT